MAATHRHSFFSGPERLRFWKLSSMRHVRKFYVRVNYVCVRVGYVCIEHIVKPLTRCSFGPTNQEVV